jgi:hypothetical protein
MAANDYPDTPEVITPEGGDALGAVAVAPLVAEADPMVASAEDVDQTHPEFSVGDVRYRYEGPMMYGYAFAGVAADGQRRQLFVWQSGSSGSLRVSPGIETLAQEDGSIRYRIMKGAPRNDSGRQYTQDTQLHPEFERGAMTIIDGIELPPAGPERNAYWAESTRITEEFKLDEEAANRAAAEFRASITRVPLGGAELDVELHKVQSGGCSEDNLRAATGDQTGDKQAVWAEFTAELDTINGHLESEDLIPDFGVEPVSSRTFEHRYLGECTTEVFHKAHDDRTYEWHVSRSASGTVWISRIRLADSEATPYGTDAEMVTSGILTSKPFDYNSNTDGIPEELAPPLNDRYRSTQAVLDRLAPIARYREQRVVA